MIMTAPRPSLGTIFAEILGAGIRVQWYWDMDEMVLFMRGEYDIHCVRDK
jgi:hypothetical protein